MQKLRSIFIMFIAQLSCVSVLHAQTASDTLNQLLKNIHSMQANFSQTVIDNSGKPLQTSRGKMALQRPNQFRWETLSPRKQLIVANGSRLWIYDPDLEQVVVRGLSSQAGQTPALLLSNANPALDVDYRVKEDSSIAEGLHWFALTPKDKSSMISLIRMGFSGNQIQEMELKDHLGHVTEIHFQNIKTNSAISSGIFRFTPPKNVDVIDETKQRR